MCFYLTAVLPKKIDIEAAKQILNQYNLDVSLINNQYLSNQLPEKNYYFRITKEYCDCDTFIGQLSKGEQVTEQEINKLKKKGWGQAKIDKWVENKKNTVEEQCISQFTVWKNCLYSILSENIAPTIGILKHWYTESLEDEKITLFKVESVKLDDITLLSFLKIEEDVLYQFHK